MLRVNPFTVLGDIRGKHQLTEFAICILGAIHYYPPFCGLTTAWLFRFLHGT